MDYGLLNFGQVGSSSYLSKRKKKKTQGLERSYIYYIYRYIEAAFCSSDVSRTRDYEACLL